MSAACVHCQRTIVNEGGRWIDPQATGDDIMWRETCDEHDTFTAEHEPFDTFSFVMAYEADELDDDAIVAGFQQLVDSGLAWQLQGSYGRMAQTLIDAGLVTR